MAIENNVLYISGIKRKTHCNRLKSRRDSMGEGSFEFGWGERWFGNVYLISADGKVIAYNGTNGREVWRVETYSTGI